MPTFGDVIKNVYDAVAKRLKVDAQLMGSTVDLRGLAADKPVADSVDPGTTYWSVDTDPNADAIEVSDGTNWKVMV